MEYFLARAFNVCRLSEEQLISLHLKESNIKRALMPFEIQDIFHIPTAKEAYMLPDDDSSLSSTMQGIRNQFRKAGLVPLRGDFTCTDLEGLHKFDERLREQERDCKISLVYSGSSKKTRITDSMA